MPQHYVALFFFFLFFYEFFEINVILITLWASSYSCYTSAFSAELGDFDPRHHQSNYVSEFRFLANQTPELEGKVSELHQGLA